MKSRAELNYIEWESERGLENLFLSMCQHYLFRKMIQWIFYRCSFVVLVVQAVADEASFSQIHFIILTTSDPPDAFVFPSQKELSSIKT